MFKIAPLFNQETGVLEVNFVMKLPEEFKSLFDDFFALYEIVNIQPNNFEQRIIKPAKERVCRFCEKGYGEVKFRKKAHVIPELMGRSNFVSDFECDTCNHFFSKFETDLAAFIGISRSLSKNKTKEGMPTYKSADKQLEIRSVIDANKSSRIQVSSSDFENDIIIDEESKTVTINGDRQTFVPLRVYKSLLKIGLTLLPEQDYTKYKRVTKMLLNNNETNDLLATSPLCRLMVYTNPGPEFPSPLAIVCEKKEQNTAVPSNTITLYFNNYVYQIFLPFCDDDMWMYDGKTNVVFHAAPPLVDELFLKRFGKPKFSSIDLSSAERKKNMPDKIVMSFESMRKESPQPET